MRAWPLALVLLCASGCKKREGQFGVDLPRYPGASYQPRDYHQSKGMKIYQAELMSPDNFDVVNRWYAKELRKLGEDWDGPADARDSALWTNGNLELDRYSKGLVIDPSDTAAGVLIVDASGRTMITLYRGDPEAKPAN